MQKTKKKYRRNAPKETQPKEIAACKRLFDAAIEVADSVYRFINLAKKGGKKGEEDNG